MDQFIPALGMVMLIKKFLDFSKFITNKDLNGALTQIYAWAVGVVGVTLYAQTEWANAFDFAGVALSDMNFASLVALGLGFASDAGVGYDIIKSRSGAAPATNLALVPSSKT